MVSLRYNKPMNTPSLENTTPVIILAGFLGAGKTTLLNHLLRHNNGQQIGVIVNDFGEVNIDSLLVSKQTENTMELSGGCICCQLGDSDLEESLSMFAHAGSTTDVVIIEASGIAEPVDLKKLILYSPNKNVRLGGVVYVIDAVNFAKTAQQHPEICDHVRTSDLLVVNKTDIATETQLADCLAQIHKLNPDAPIVRTAQGKLNPELLFDHAEKEAQQLTLGAAPSNEPHDHTHLHDSFTSVSFHSKKPLSPKHVQDMLAKLPTNIFRLKGVLYYGMKGFEQKVVLHKVGQHLTQRAEEWHSHETPASDIVAIGVDLDKTAVQKLLQNCIDPSPDNITPDDMIDIMRLKGF